MRSNFGRGINVKLVGRVRKNDGANIAAFNDQVVLVRVIAHPLHKSVANFGHGAYAWNFGVHAIFVEVSGKIDIVNQETKFSVFQLAAQL